MRGKADIEYYKKLGKQMREIRKEEGLNQKEVASKIGITFQQLQKYERGENRIPTKAVVTFCELTNTDIQDLTGCMANKKMVSYNTNIRIKNNLIIIGFFRF